jgi:hypothetical protein
MIEAWNDALHRRLLFLNFLDSATLPGCRCVWKRICSFLLALCREQNDVSPPNSTMIAFTYHWNSCKTENLKFRPFDGYTITQQRITHFWPSSKVRTTCPAGLLQKQKSRKQAYSGSSMGIDTTAVLPSLSEVITATCLTFPPSAKVH